MTTITTEANHVAERARRFVQLAPRLERALTADMVDALSGTSTSDGPRRASIGDDPEPPTGHQDPTGDIATTGAVTAVRRRQVRIIDALMDIDRAFDHLERVVRAEVVEPQPQPPLPSSYLCNAGRCNRIKERGELCATHAADAEAEQRRTAPRCWTCGIEPVEMYATVSGWSFRRMRRDDHGVWHPNDDGPPPQCVACRKRTERIAGRT